MKNNLMFRWLYLILGVVSMLFAGIIYGWSIINAPFTHFWDASQLALNFTITMTCFCLGGFLGAKLSKKFGIFISITISGLLSTAGFLLASRLDGSNVILLYLTYGVLAGLGIGIAYNAVISTVNAWFPDRKGLCSGALMMGFGASSLIIAKWVSNNMAEVGWQTAYVQLGCALGAVLLITALILRRPDENTVLPAPKIKKAAKEEAFEVKDYTTGEMLRRPSFWMAFACLGLLGAVGSSVISFAKNLSIAVGAEESLALTLVGVLSVCNGLGRIFTGALFDAMGRRRTMLISNIISIAAAGVTLLAVTIHSLPVCIAGLCLVGMSYGSCPTVSSAFVSSFYGTKFFPSNFSLMNFNLIGSSLMATVCGSLLTSTGGYMAPFAVLLGLSVVALVLNLMIKKP